MGDHYVVDGNKKWITNGIYADYFTVACRTGAANRANAAKNTHGIPLVPIYSSLCAAPRASRGQRVKSNTRESDPLRP
eukprot:6126885-Pyramimonas_sp.AAC.1